MQTKLFVEQRFGALSRWTSKSSNSIVPSFPARTSMGNALYRAWSLCSGKLPHYSTSTNLIIKPDIVQEVESVPWVLYTDDGRPSLHSLECDY